MQKKKIIISAIIIILIILAGALIWDIKYEAKKNASEFQQYLTLKESGLSQAQLTLYNQTKETLAKDPLDKDALIDLANLYTFKEIYPTAEEILKKIDKIYKNDTVALQNLANIYNDTKRFKEAEQMYYQILDNNILWMPAYDSLSQLYRFKLVENNLEFPKMLEKARAADYSDQYESSLLKILGFYYQYQGDNQKSLEYFSQYLKRNPNDEAIKGVIEGMK